LSLPAWAPELRLQQVSAIQTIIEQFNHTNVVILEAPTGSGKTLIADQVMQALECRTLYSCSSISLQHQFLRDFPSATLLKGRSNYPTLDHPERFNSKFSTSRITCADCNKKRDSEGNWECNQCSDVHQCPYELAKSEAVRSDLTCVNTHYFLYECNYVGALRNRDLVVVDECDTLEDTLLSFIQVHITPKQIEKYDLPKPDRKTVEASWIEWSTICHDLVKRQLSQLTRTIPDYPTLAQIREQRSLSSLAGDFGRLLSPVSGLGSGNWVYDGYGEGHIIFKPISVSSYGNQYLWRHGKKWLLMSATVISAEELAGRLGLI
jgi:Rad3-related DNA helicase